MIHILLERLFRKKGDVGKYRAKLKNCFSHWKILWEFESFAAVGKFICIKVRLENISIGFFWVNDVRWCLPKYAKNQNYDQVLKIFDWISFPQMTLGDIPKIKVFKIGFCFRDLLIWVQSDYVILLVLHESNFRFLNLYVMARCFR